MGIKSFIIWLLIISIVLFIYTIVIVPIKTVKKKVLPEIIFKNSIMYDIDIHGVKQLIESKKMYHYSNNHEEFYYLNMLFKSKNDKKEVVIDSLNANFLNMTKIILKFRGDVYYNRSDNTMLQSQSIDYDRINNHLIGNQKFIAIYKDNKLEGDSLFIKKGEAIIKSNNNVSTPVKLDIVINKKETNETN
ncbi:hypothetical protein MNB_ARC-1_214 [hydrothermal vent metagenome]|uniref:LPS export ABC transporter periplasmic protein LptC n=1 Tax=hydrothermal vent metagenome TaxID=652676 RepID=A0A3B1DX93_9ZZZZ